MAKLLQLRRGTTTQHSTFAGAEGEVTVDTDNDALVVHDGSTVKGRRCKMEVKGQTKPFMQSSTNQALILGF